MFKDVLSLTFAVCCASAATISTSATCNGVTTVGTFDAFCSDGFGGFAHAHLTAPSFVDTRIAPVSFVGFVVSGGTLGQISASANFSDDYVFTVFGGTGDGLFLPCFSGFSDSGAGVSMSFGGIAFAPNIFNPSNCIGNQPAPFTPAPKPFTFDLPEIIHVDITGSSSSSFFREEGATRSLDDILFFDTHGNPLSNVTFTLVSTTVPEPSARSLLGVGLMFFLAVTFWKSRVHVSLESVWLKSPGTITASPCSSGISRCGEVWLEPQRSAIELHGGTQ